MDRFWTGFLHNCKVKRIKEIIITHETFNFFSPQRVLFKHIFNPFCIKVQKKKC